MTTVLSELTWSHYLELIDIEKQDERQFYEVFSVKESWSVRVLQGIHAAQYRVAIDLPQVVSNL